MISIVIPLYNKEKTILSTLSSVQFQLEQNWECVIVDDGSTDNSAQIVKEFIKSDDRFIYYLKANGGPSSARNYGVAKASGEWVVFLDADDLFEQFAVQFFYKVIQLHPKYRCFAFNYYINSDGKKVLYSKNMKEGLVENPYKEWYYKNFMPRTGAAVFKKEVLINNLHKEYLRRYEDAEMLFNIFRTEKFFQLSIPVMTYNCDTLAASVKRDNFQEDFFAHIEPKGKPFWEQMILYDYYKSALALYGGVAITVYPKNPFSPIIVLLVRIVKLRIRLTRKHDLSFLKTFCPKVDE